MTLTSYWKVFRLIFVIFSLYLMGDAFYRWDGFRYYAIFSEFLPAVALITILWSVYCLADMADRQGIGMVFPTHGMENQGRTLPVVYMCLCIVWSDSLDL